jgi:hypothetical protein
MKALEHDSLLWFDHVSALYRFISTRGKNCRFCRQECRQTAVSQGKSRKNGHGTDAA